MVRFSVVAIVSFMFVPMTLAQPGCYFIIRGGPIFVDCPCDCTREHTEESGKCMVCRHYSDRMGSLYKPSTQGPVTDEQKGKQQEDKE